MGRQHGRGVGRDHVGHQALIARHVLAQYNGGVGYAPSQRLSAVSIPPNLHPKTPDLHLIVEPP